MEKIIQPLIFIHAALGGLALLAGSIALAVRKGGPLHRRAGKVFFGSMLISALLAVIISLLPDHESPFLLAIGIFTIYLIGTGLRATRFKRKEINARWDKAAALLMADIGILMFVLPWLLYDRFNIVLGVFGSLALLLAISDFRRFSKPETLRSNWLRMHLTKMTGGFIASVTAFIVVNQFIPGIFGWLTPTVVGTAFIVYQSRKLG